MSVSAHLAEVFGVDIDDSPALHGPDLPLCSHCREPGARIRCVSWPLEEVEAEWACLDERECRRRANAAQEKRDAEQRARDRAAKRAKYAAERGVAPRRR